MMYILTPKDWNKLPCTFCYDREHAYSSKDTSEVVTMYRNQGAEGYLEIEVIVPRCEKCASKQAPVLPLAAILTLLVLAGSIMYCLTTEVIFFSIILALILDGIFFSFTIASLQWSFNFVYKSDPSKYAPIAFMENKYGWTFTKPSKDDDDIFFTKSDLDDMAIELDKFYNCAIMVKQ